MGPEHFFSGGNFSLRQPQKLKSYQRKMLDMTRTNKQTNNVQFLALPGPKRAFAKQQERKMPLTFLQARPQEIGTRFYELFTPDIM